MKKILLTMALALLTAAGAWAQTSGTCGENLTWTLSDDGTLTISGTGDMENYNWNSSTAPWYPNRTNIKTVVIENGVTSIGNYAFYWCSALTEVTIPEGVTSIGDYAFYGCAALTQVNIPNSVTSIGSDAFRGCSSLKQVTIPNSVTSIGYSAFENCSALTQVTIPEGVTSIGSSAFRDCSSLTQITIPESVTSIGYSAFENCSALTQVTIPEGVTSIGDSAFRGCSALTQVTIPEGVTSIGSSAFNGCSALTQITIPESVTSIGISAFYGSALTSITIPNSVTSIGNEAFNGCSSLTAIHVESGNTAYCSENGVLFNKDKTTLIQYPAGKPDATYAIPESVTSIGWSAFYYYCSALTQVTIPESVTSIGYMAFYHCSKLTSVRCEATTPPTLGTNCFSGTPLSVVYIPTGATADYTTAWGSDYVYVEDGNEVDITVHVETPGQLAAAIVEKGSTPAKVNRLTVTGTLNDTDFSVIKNNMVSLFDLDLSGITNTTMPNAVFEGKSALLTIALPSGLTAIPHYAFSGCKISEISIPKSVTSIGNYAFYWCSALTEVTIPEGVTSIGDRAFYDCSALTQVTIPEGVTSIGNYAFFICSALTQITIPNSVTSIGEGAFQYCSSLTAIHVESGNTAYCSENGVLFNKDKTTLIQYPAAKQETTYIIPSSVTSIGDWAFYHCSALTQVTIPESVTSIGEGAFNDCSSLTQVTIPESVTSIGNGAFYGCSALTAVVWNAANCADFSSSINAPFYDRANITSFTFGENVEHIPAYLCCGMSKLTQVTIPEGVTSIGDWAFYHCSALTQVTIPESVTSIGEGAFQYCSSLTAIHVESGNTAYCSENGVLFNKDKTTLIQYPAAKQEATYTIPNSVTSIGDWAFYYCRALTQVTIPNSVTSIGDWAFYYCRALTQVTIPNSVTSIGNDAFYGCSALTVIYVESGNTAYCSEDGVLFNKDKTTLIQYPAEKPDATYAIPNSVTSIGNWAFSDCSALTKITIPESVTSIGDRAFYECTALKQVTIGSGVTSIGDYAFYGCSKLTQVTIPENVTSIGSLAFSGTGIYNNESNWVNNVLYIDNCLIEAKTELSGSYEITEGTRLIADYAFQNCRALTEITIPNSVTSIGDWAFYYCRALTQVTIPNSVTSIGDWAFYYCRALTQVTIPNSVTSIGSYAFSSCSALTQVTIGSSVTSIGNDAFYGCSALTVIYVESGNTAYCSEDGVLFNKDKTTLIQYPAEKPDATYAIPNSVTSIGNWAFSDCSALTKITIPESVTSIGDYAFEDCIALNEMTILATTPPTIGGSATFYEVDKSIPVYVPAASIDDYKAADGWSEFTNYLSVEDKGNAALHAPSMPESIRVVGGTLHNPQGLPVSIVDLQGRVVYSGTATAVSQPAGVYVVRCAGASRKVLF